MSSPDPALRLAAVLLLPGPEQLFGRRALRGARLAVAENNGAGGLLGGRPGGLPVRDQSTDNVIDRVPLGAPAA